MRKNQLPIRKIKFIPGNLFLLTWIVLLSPFLISIANAKDNKQLSPLGNVNISDNQNKDIIGYDDQYNKDISNIYLGKDQIDHYRGSSPADVLKGAIGVYSGEPRNGGALDPNIRGVQGQGRVPVTIDGTEQAITVYRGYSGANNRNYLDPNLISSVSIDKGAALDPNIKTSTGGGIAIKTLGIDDIVPKGDNFGINLRLETRSNSINAHAPNIPTYFPGNDYRTDPNYQTITTKVSNGYTSEIHDALLERPAKTTKDNKFPGFQDNAFRIGLGWRETAFDLLFAYSYRNQGNYFAGKGGAQRYSEHITENQADVIGNQQVLSNYALPFVGGKDVDPFLPYAAEIYKPGSEVPNTSNEMQSVLIKNTWRFNGDQSLQFGFRDTHTRFGDIMPSRLGSIPWLALDNDNQPGWITQWPLGRVHMLAANIAYKWQPENSRWIDLDMNFWLTRTNSDTNTGGGTRLREPFHRDYKYDIWLHSDRSTLPPLSPPPEGENDKYFSLVNTVITNSRNNRYGIDLSNKFTLTNNINLTLMGSFQYETLDSSDDRYKQNLNNNDAAMNNYQVNFPVPRKGKRQENSFAFNFDYRPVSWLLLSAGAKRVSYWSQDDMLKELVDNRLKDPSSAGIPDELTGGVEVEYLKLANQQEGDLLRGGDVYAPVFDKPFSDFVKPGMTNEEVIEAGIVYGDENYKYRAAYEAKYESNPAYNSAAYKELEPHVAVNDSQKRMHPDGNLFGGDQTWISGGRLSQFRNPANSHRDELQPEDTYYIFHKDKVPYKNGKLNADDDPFYNGTVKLNNLVTNTGKSSTPEAISKAPDLAPEYLPMPNPHNKNPQPYFVDTILKPPEKRKDHAWAPVFSATVYLNDNARFYTRYAESARMPSIFEDTIGFSGTQGIAGYTFKPERAKNTEVGFIYNLKSLVKASRNADFRIDWYHTDIDNAFDRDGNFNFVQMDKMKLAGIEALARYDNGYLFASAGLDYNLKYKVCDRSQRLIYDFTFQKTLPECVDGGFPGGFLRTTIPPRYSLNATLGTRLLDNKIEIGSRWLYHSSVVNKDEKKYADLLKDQYFSAPMRWNPVLTVDAYIDYNINKYLQLELSGENLTNRYYLDPLTRSMIPAPGRTVKLAINASF